MPGHADVHMSMVPEALYLCGSEREKGEQDNTVRKTKEEADREGNLWCCTTCNVHSSFKAVESQLHFSNLVRKQTLYSEAYL